VGAGLGWAGLGWVGRLSGQGQGRAGRQATGGRAVTVAMTNLTMRTAVVIAMPVAMTTSMATMTMVVLVNLLWQVVGGGQYLSLCVCVCVPLAERVGSR
jgi:hypothetical protein